MKGSLKLREEQHHRNPLLRLKIPITVLGFPFISGITAGDPGDLSFNLCTNSLTGPSLKLSYNPNTTITPTTNPFSISLKSGVGIFGSPFNSPLIMSAHFNLTGNLNPTFSLQIKPQFGDFSLKKTAVSASFHNPNPNPNHDLPKENGGVHFNNGGVGVMPERPMAWRDLRTELNGAGDGFFSGMAVMAKTVLPLTKRAAVKLRWGVNFPSDFGAKMKLPFLTVDKIGIERIGEVVKVKSNDNGADLELLKGICSWMKREMEVLQMENRAMKESLDDMKTGITVRNNLRDSNNVGKKSLPAATGNSSEFERWKSKSKTNGGEVNGRKETKTSGGSENPVSDIGEELKRAIQAASS